MERFLTTEEVARLLVVSRRTLEGWRTKGLGPPYRRLSHRCVRYDQADVLRWSEDRSSLSSLERFSPHARALAEHAEDVHMDYGHPVGEEEEVPKKG